MLLDAEMVRMGVSENALKGKAYISFDFFFKKKVLYISIVVIDQTQ